MGIDSGISMRDGDGIEKVQLRFKNCSVSMDSLCLKSEKGKFIRINRNNEVESSSDRKKYEALHLIKLRW